MVKKVVVVIIALAFVLTALSAAFSETKKDKSLQAAQLAAVLPESDGVLLMDSNRFFSEALPQVLSANQPKLDKIMSEVDKIKAKTGIDLEQFEQVAVGVKMKKVGANEIDFEPVILARGTYNAAALVAVAKLASNGKYRTEQVGNRTIYVFSAKEIAKDNKPKTKDDSWFDKFIERTINGLTNEIAVTGYDSNTLAIGTIGRVRETLQSKTRLNSGLLDLVYRKQNAVMSFGANLPNGMSDFVNLGNDELGKNIDSIRQVYGAMNVNGADATVSLTAKTQKAEQAKNLYETMVGLQMVGKALIGTKSADKQVYTRMVENAKISNNGSEVIFDLAVPQSDIDILLGKK